MRVCKTAADMQSIVHQERQKGKKIGFVPTMGALHEGHISLLTRCLDENDFSICSIFVNPKQFNNASDLTNYPRSISADLALLEKADCDLAFCPDYSEVYPHEMPTPIDLGLLGQCLESAYRPGHFEGVAVVVKRLFELTNPHCAYFGLKDFQQFAVVKRLVSLLKMDIEVIGCPTVRTAQGLALSSRNMLLSESEKTSALALYDCLVYARSLVRETSMNKIKQKVVDRFKNSTDPRLEYFEIVDGETLEPVISAEAHSQIVALIAAYLGKVRLIDNLILIP
ncbi:MAG: pantoate--beta-alanine ligase [Vicingaceae bacterium]